jgi:hypothetical protein
VGQTLAVRRATWAYPPLAALEITLSRGLREAVGNVDPEERRPY